MNASLNPSSPNFDDMKTRVKQRVDASIRRKKVVRRTLWAGLGTAAMAGAFLTLPVARGMAALRQIDGALNDVDAFQSVSYSILENGTRVRTGEMAYDEGKWRIQDPGRALMIYRDGTRFTYDDWMKVFVREVKPEGPFLYNTKGLGVEHLLGSGAPALLSLEDEQTVSLNGHEMRRLELKNKFASEWLTIYADPKTGLPQKMDSYSLRDETKTLRGTAEFTYDKPDASLFLMPWNPGEPRPLKHLPYSGGVTPELVDGQDNRPWSLEVEPDVLRVPPPIEVMTPSPKILDKEAWDLERRRRMTTRTVAKATFGRSKILIRDLAVEPDGTIWVAYQTGRTQSGWSGHVLSVEPRNEYCHGPEFPSEEPVSSARAWGRVEFQCFIPVDSKSSGSFKLLATPNGEGNFVRDFPRMTENNRVVDKGTSLIAKFDAAKFPGTMPGYLRGFMGSNKSSVEIIKAQAVADYWEGERQDERAIAAHRRVLDLMREHTGRGFVGWDEERSRNAVRRLEISRRAP